MSRSKPSREGDRPSGSRTASAKLATSSAPSQRMLRVAEVIRHELSALLARGDIHDDTLASAVITVPEVRMSPDLKLATVYVMPLGGDKVEAVIAALEANKRFIRGVLAKSVNLKFAPDVRFRPDETFEEASRIGRLLDSPKVRQDTAKPVQRRPASKAADPDAGDDADPDA